MNHLNTFSRLKIKKYNILKRKRTVLQKFLFLLLIFISANFGQQNPKQSIMDINDFTLWVRDDGFHDWVIDNDEWCSEYPKGKGGVIYTEGIVWGGKVFDGNEKIIRVSGSNFVNGNSALTRLYRIRTDYFDADLTSDAVNFFRVSPSNVTQSMIDEIYKQYEKDWKEWPADKGAPYYDVNKDGKYEMDEDIPGVPGASQTIWINYSDSNAIYMYGSPTIGLEVHETYWAYAYTGTLGNIIYKKVDIAYKGTQTTSADSRIDSMYVCQYVEPDVGDYFDDFSGCDTLLNLGYTYNAYPHDAVYDKFNLAPPAVGYSIIQGISQFSGSFQDSAIFNFKWRKGYKYISPNPMSTFIYDAPGNNYSSPQFNYTGALEFYNYMRGYMPEPHYPSSSPFPDMISEVTPYGVYLLPGDPVTGTGKIDGRTSIGGDSPGNRQMYIETSSFNMNLGDTVELVYAIAGGLGDNNLNSITELRRNINGAVLEYNNLVSDFSSGEFNLPEINRPQFTSSPKEYILFQNYPNPFNSTTVIKYELPDDAHVKLVIYDILGRVVNTLVDEEKTAGIYKVSFNAGNLSSGIYFSKISFSNSRSKLIFDNLTKVNKLLLLK